MNLMLILCQSYQDAQDAFDIWVSFLDENWPLDTSVRCEPHANIVASYQGITYMFIVENMVDVYLEAYKHAEDPSLIYVDEFMEGI